MTERTHCPRCGKKLRMKWDRKAFIPMGWKVCTKACGWTVFTHGNDPRDKADA